MAMSRVFQDSDLNDLEFGIVDMLGQRAKNCRVGRTMMPKYAFVPKMAFRESRLIYNPQLQASTPDNGIVRVCWHYWK